MRDRVHIDVAAYHEAGHVVAALSAGLWVKQVHVSFGNPGAGFMVHAPLPRNPFDPGDGPGATRAAWEHTLRNRIAVIRVALAGPLAEAKALGKPLRALGARSDLDLCREHAEQLRYFHAYLTSYAPLLRFESAELLNRERRQVRRWVGRRHIWANIRNLADCLTCDGSLDWGQICNALNARDE